MTPTDLGQQLGEGQTIRWTQGDCRLKLDRELPFLILYRGRNEATRALLRTEAAYLFAPPDQPVDEVLEQVIRSRRQLFGAFLVLEIRLKRGETDAPTFTVYSGKDTEASDLAETLLTELRRVPWNAAPVVEMSHGQPQPRRQSAPAPNQEYLYLGLELNPLYQDEAGNVLPLLLRGYRRRLGRVLRRFFYRFTSERTSMSPPNFHTLGPRALVKRVWSVDEELAKCSERFSFLLLITPINAHQAWSDFRRSGYQEEPTFHYRPLPHDPSLLKRELYAVPVERIEDPTLHALFLEKQEQLDTKITMLSRRRSKRFLYGSLSLYGRPDEELTELARALLALEFCEEPNERVEAQDFAELARREVAIYRRQYEGFTAEVQIRKDLGSSVLCDKGHLLIDSRAQFLKHRVLPLIHHEVGTHLVTFYNGQTQPLRQLALGLNGYLELQEGLAVLSECLCGSLSPSRLRQLATRVLAVGMMLDGASFVETFTHLHEAYQLKRKPLFNLVMRIYRGGGLTKDAIYLRGLASLVQRIRDGLELEPLFVGKIGIHHLPLVSELQWRKVLKPAPLRPLILKRREAQKRIKAIKNGMSLTELVQL